LKEEFQSLLFKNVAGPFKVSSNKEKFFKKQKKNKLKKEKKQRAKTAVIM